MSTVSSASEMLRLYWRRRNRELSTHKMTNNLSMRSTIRYIRYVFDEMPSIRTRRCGNENVSANNSNNNNAKKKKNPLLFITRANKCAYSECLRARAKLLFFFLLCLIHQKWKLFSFLLRRLVIKIKIKKMLTFCHFLISDKQSILSQIHLIPWPARVLRVFHLFSF